MAFQNKVDYEPIGNNRFLEKNRLIEANSVNVIETAEFPGLPNDCVKEKFRCSTKFALSLKNQLLAIVTPSRELELYALKDDLIVPKCRVRVLHDPHPEYCLLEWSASQNLLLSTRSTAVLDVFDCNGVYCYSISLGDNTFDASKIISHITTTSSTDPDTYDLAYVLQLHSRFSVFRLGKGNAFDQIFNYNLNIPRTYCLLYIPSNHLLAVSTEYLVDKPVTDATSPMEIGLALFEYRHQQLTKKVLPVPKTGWIWMPFLQKQRAVVVSLEADLERQSVLAVTSRGDILLFDFFFHLQRFIKGELIPEVKLMQGILINGESVAALYRHGLIVQEKLELFFDSSKNQDLQGTVIEDAQQLCQSFPDEVFVLAEKEQSSSTALVSGSDYVNQFWLFTVLRVNFIYEWIKVLTGAMMGQPMEDVRADYEKLFQFAIYRIKTVTLNQYIKKLLATGEYAEAEKLAIKDGEFDLDLIFKQQWLDAVETDESLVSVLRKVKDKTWVITECLNCKSTDPEIQRMLLDLAEMSIDEVNDPVLNEKVKNARLIFNCLEEVPDVFLKYRSMSLVEAALHFAEEANIDLLIKFVENHSRRLKRYIIMILKLIPESINVSRYEQIFPWKSSKKGGKFVLDENFEAEEAIPARFVDEGFQPLILTNEMDDICDFFVNWCKNRASEIDNNSGLIENAVDFLKIAIEHGFDDLKPVLRRFLLYSEFVMICSAVSLTFDRFLTLDSTALKNAIIKYMNESQISNQMMKIINLFEEFHPKTAADDILFVVKKFSEHNFASLHSLYSIRPHYVSKELLTACFLECSLVGPPLICTLEKFNFEENITEALQICINHGYEPQFSHLFYSRDSDEMAEQILLRFLKNALDEPEMNYISVLDSMKKLRQFLYQDLIDDKQIIKLFASELLSKLANERFLGFPFHLVVDVSAKDPKKLSSEEWQDLLLNKSLDFLDRSMPSLKDTNLILAREVLTLIPGKQHLTEKLKKQKDLIEITELCIQLGSERLPTTYRFCEPEMILQEIVSVKENYKQVKKCAEISKLLGLKPPVAKAMAYCTVEALKANDFSTVEKYLWKLNSTCRDMPIIYHFCKDIVATGKWKSLYKDLVTCMVLNCPADEMDSLFDYLKDCPIGLSSQKSDKNSLFPENVTEKLVKLKGNLMDASKQEQEDESSVKDDELHLDPLYTSMQHFHQLAKSFEAIPVESNHMASKWTQNSATMAVLTAVLEDDEDFTNNDMLRKIAVGIRALIKKGHVKNFEKIPTEFLIRLASNEQENSVHQTPLERVLQSGCDRERFFEDSEYRKDTLLGLIMTKDEKMISDVKTVAGQFKVPIWDLYLSLVEYILTDSEVTPNEAKNMIKEHNLRDELWKNLTEFYKSMRSSILPLMSDKDLNKLKLYLTFFKQPEPEYFCFKCLPTILKVDSSCRLKEFVSGQKDVVLKWVKLLFDRPEFDDEFISTILKLIKAYPSNEILIAEITNYLKKNQEVAPNRKVRLLFYVVERKFDLLIDLMEEELGLSSEEFWNQVLNSWEATGDKTEDRLLDKIRKRIQQLNQQKQQVEVPPALEVREETTMFRRKAKH